MIASDETANTYKIKLLEFAAHRKYIGVVRRPSSSYGAVFGVRIVAWFCQQTGTDEENVYPTRVLSIMRTY